MEQSGAGLDSIRLASKTSFSSPLPITSAIWRKTKRKSTRRKKIGRRGGRIKLTAGNKCICKQSKKLPKHTHTLTSSSGVLRLSSSSDLILEYWTESSRCLPEQWMQMRIPRLTLSHVGSGPPQSQHLSLPGRLRILVTILWRGTQWE